MKRGTKHSQSALDKMRRPRGPRRDAHVRFTEKIDYNGPIIRLELGPCHVWTGKRRRGKFRYGQFFYRGRWVEAHRWIFERSHGALPKGYCALHKCDLPECVRQDHLFAGTRAENIFDMDRKGRRVPARGERQRDAKLSYKMADLILWCYRIAGMRIKKLASDFEVSETTISNIVHGRTWRLEAQAA